MFVQSVIASFVVLIGCNAAVWCRKWWLSLPILAVGILSCPFLVTVVCHQSLITIPCLLLLLIPKIGRPLFTIASIAAMAFAFWSLFDAAEKKNERYEELRAKYPMESMALRIPEPKPAAPNRRIDEQQLSRFESGIKRSPEDTEQRYIFRLHRDQVWEFANQSGFGFDRMRSIDEGHLIHQESMWDESRLLNHYQLMPPDEVSFGDVVSSGGLDPSLSNLHLSSTLDFVNPRGFGYIKNRTQVAGFRPHRFSEYPKSTTGWSIRSVELVGVLVHDTPGAYLSEHLPRMDELKGAKTRPLDVFEKEGLAELEKGEELFVRGKDNSARMMGAIRNAKQCVECHGGQRGDLLGAFSYRLKK